jgi:acyl-CoA hydrolase
MPARVSAAEAIASLPRGARVLVATAAGESPLLAAAVMAAGEAVEATFTGVFLPGIARPTYLPNARCRVETFFLTPELAAAPPGQVRFLPLCYADIRAHLVATPIDAALMTVAPPGADGRCSFGPAVDFLAELWPQVPLRIAHLNPLLPVTRGDRGIPFDALDLVVEGAAPLPAAPADRGDAATEAIARHVAAVVPDGATLQTGIGKVPAAVLRALAGHRGLRVHSGLIGDGVVDLLEAGALAPGQAVTAGLALGGKRLYDAVRGEAFAFAPVPVTHGAATIAAIPRFVAINSGLEVDLWGQVHAEVGPAGALSGPGGASDYARAARLSPGGLRIVALPADAAGGRASRIVAAGEGRGPVSLGRFDTDLVVTEHGVADLRGQDHAARAAALIRVAAPAHRDALIRSWATGAGKLFP